jgi:hypothetical protein
MKTVAASFPEGIEAKRFLDELATYANRDLDATVYGDEVIFQNEEARQVFGDVQPTGKENPAIVGAAAVGAASMTPYGFISPGIGIIGANAVGVAGVLSEAGLGERESDLLKKDFEDGCAVVIVRTDASAVDQEEVERVANNHNARNIQVTSG